jgi:protein involved in polysaccharide export with SLBB domain
MVCVGGQVRKPGRLAMSPGITLGSAVERAGGATDFGSLRRVRLLREGEVREFDLSKPEYAATPLLADDGIEIPVKNYLGR